MHYLLYNNKTCKLLKNIKTNFNDIYPPVSQIQHFYDQFYPGYKYKVYKSLYPQSFLDDLFTSTDSISFKLFNIEIKFIIWTISKLFYKKPIVTEPEVTEPEITEPEVIESEITEPEVIESEIQGIVEDFIILPEIKAFNDFEHNFEIIEMYDQTDNIIVILFYNKIMTYSNVAYFKKEDIDCLKYLSDYTDDIEIKNIAFLPNNSTYLVNEFRYNFDSRITNYLLDIYKIHKFITKTDIPKIYIKSVLEFLYSTYDIIFDDVTNLSIDTFRETFYQFNISKFRMHLNILIDNNHICNIIKFLGFTISNNSIWYLKIKPVPDTIDLNLHDKISKLITATHIYSADLRGTKFADD
jgi:hypothetical protein